MKSASFILPLLFATVSARAAITITISPVAGGTRFTIEETSPNPVFSTDQVTGGSMGGIALAKQSIAQDPALYSQNLLFSITPGTFTKPIGSGATVSTIVGLYFAFSSVADGIVPILNLDVPMSVPPGSDHQFALSPTVGADVALPFSWFTAGTTVENSVLFGTVTTTVVIPEPASPILGAAGVVAVASRRRRIRLPGA